MHERSVGGKKRRSRVRVRVPLKIIGTLYLISSIVSKLTCLKISVSTWLCFSR